MLSRDNFDLAMTMFGEYYNYDYSQNELAISEWYRVLSQLEDNELYPCLKAAIAKFPRRPLSPLDVIENFKPSPKSDLIAWEEWKSIQNGIRFPDNALILSPMAELALEALGGIRTISALLPEKLSYSANNFVKLWLMYEESINNGTRQIPSQKLPEVREVYKSPVVNQLAKNDMNWWHRTIEERMPKELLAKLSKARSEQSEPVENIPTQVDGWTLYSKGQSYDSSLQVNQT
jgi:hypothetical protein